MKIHFCDLCNESVPQGDLDQGRAFLRKGRVVCAACDRSMSHDKPEGLAEGSSATSAGSALPAGAVHEAQAVTGGASAGGGAALPPATPAAPRASGAGWLAAATLVFTLAAIALLVERDGELERRLGGLSAGLEGLERSTLARGDASASALETRLRDAEERLEVRLAEELARSRAGLERLETLLAEASRRREGDVAGLEALRAELSSLRQEQAERVAALGARLERGEQDVAFHGKRLTDLEMAQLVRNAPLAPQAAAEPTWQQKVPDLASPVAGTRYEAVDALGRSADPAVVPHLVPLLKDVDTFVRMATARVLGTLGSSEGVEPLFEALEDDEAAVREAAWVSLLALTGRDFRYDPLGVEVERQKRRKAWVEWWRKEGARAGSGAEVAGSAG